MTEVLLLSPYVILVSWWPSAVLTYTRTC